MACRDTRLLRAVIREDMSMAMVDELIKDIARAVEYLDTHFTINVNDVHRPDGKSLVVSPAHAHARPPLPPPPHFCCPLAGDRIPFDCMLESQGIHYCYRHSARNY